MDPKSGIARGASATVVALLLTACLAAPAAPGATRTPDAASATTAPSAASPVPTTSPTPIARPQVGLAWTQVVDPDLASYPDMGQLDGVIAGGPGAIAWGTRWGPPDRTGAPPDLGPTIWTTVDGRDWVPATVERPGDADPASPGEVIDITPGGPGFVAIGTYFRAGDEYAPVVWTSVDARTWQRVPDQPAFRHSLMRQVMPWGGRLLAVGCSLASAVDCGADAVWTSADAATWEKVAPVLPEGISSVGIVTPGSDRLWGIGADDSGIAAPYQDAPPPRLISIDGRTWAATALPVLGIERLHPVAGGLYLTVSAIPGASDDYAPPAAWVSRKGGLFRSTDLAHWERLDPGAQIGGEVVDVDGTLVMIGAAGTGCWLPWRCTAAAWRSTDGGETWTSSPVTPSQAAGPPGATMRSVARLADGTLVAVGVLTQTDGTPSTGTWVSAPQPGR